MDLGSLSSIFLIILFLAVSFWLTVFLHELGHAIPILLMSNGRVSIFIGSLGSVEKSFIFSLGRIQIFSKFNPVRWTRGCCKPPESDFTVFQRLLYIACGPIASVIVTAISYLLLKDLVVNGVFRLFTELIFFISIVVTIGCVFPSTKTNFTPLGTPIHNDAYQFISLYKSRKLPQIYWTAVLCMKNKDYSAACHYLEQLIINDWRDLSICRMAVSVHALLKNYPRAIEIQGWMEEKYVFNADDYSNAGFLDIQTGRLPEAGENLQKSLAMNPNHIYSLNSQGYLLCLKERFYESIPYFDRIISLVPDFISAYENRGYARVMADELESGMADIQHCLELNDGNADAYRNWGIYCLKKGALDQAETMFLKAREIDADTAFVDKYLNEVGRLKLDARH